MNLQPVILSMGLLRPAQAAHRPIRSTISCGFSGAELLFTDDRADNIGAAHLRGWKTHLFTGPEGWANRLVDEGLLTEEEAI